MKKIFTLIVMLTAVLTMSAEETANYCLCATTKGGTKTNDKGETVKKDFWDDQITYTPTVSLTKGKSYKLSLVAKASENCSLAFWPIWNASTNKNQWGGSTDVQYLAAYSVSTDWKTLTWEFTANYDIDGLDFEFGGLNGSIMLDDFSLVETGVSVNFFTNGSFEQNSSTGWSTKSSYNGTTIKVVTSDYTGPVTIPEPVIPDTWEFAKQGDPNFHIYLAFGQSNMEGAAQEEAVDKQNIPERFKMMASTNFDNPKRTMGEWYQAVTPICSPIAHLSPCEYFGRYLCENLPEEIKVGVISVAAGGAPIEMFMEELMDNSGGDWSRYLASTYYDGDMLKRLVDMGKKAQEVGVIKGILLHQGESNCGSSEWAGKVAKIYKRICYRLGLNPAEVPLLAGETLYENMGGGCSWHNVAAMPMLKNAIPNSYVISAKDLPGNGKDAWHFSAAGYRELGKRYGEKMLEIIQSTEGINETVFVAPWQVGKTFDLSGREVGADYKGIVIENGVKKVQK